MEHVLGLQGDDSDTDDLLCSSDSSNSLSSSNSLDHDRSEQCWPSGQQQQQHEVSPLPFSLPTILPSAPHTLSPLLLVPSQQHWADPACVMSVDPSAQPHVSLRASPPISSDTPTSLLYLQGPEC